MVGAAMEETPSVIHIISVEFVSGVSMGTISIKEYAELCL
jgi:hypothetical protein